MRYRLNRRYLQTVRAMYRVLRHPKLRHRTWWQKITKPIFNKRLWKPCRATVAMGLAAGTFFAFLPIPAQMLFAAIAAMRLRGNVPIAMAVCWITNPATMLIFIPAQIWIGNLLQDWLNLPMPQFLLANIHIEKIGNVGAGVFFLGSVASALILSLLCFPIVHAFSILFPKILPRRREPFHFKKSPDKSPYTKN